MVLVEVLAQLGIHPIPESYVHRLEELAFKHFRAQETLMDRWALCVCVCVRVRGVCVHTHTHTCAYVHFQNLLILLINIY